MMSVRFGLVSGLAVVLLTLIGVALINLPRAEGAVPQGGRSDESCPTVQIPQDQGYGVSRVVTEHICSGTAGR